MELSQGKQVNIYTDSKYAFLALHAHIAIWKERRYLTANVSPIKYHKEIDCLLLAIFQPAEVVIIHCKGHQNGTDQITEESPRADIAIKAATREPWKSIEAPLVWEDSLRDIKPCYTQKEKAILP